LEDDEQLGEVRAVFLLILDFFDLPGLDVVDEDTFAGTIDGSLFGSLDWALSIEYFIK